MLTKKSDGVANGAHLAPWVGLFFEELESAKTAKLYMPVGTIGKLFMAIEGEAFEIAA